MVVCYHSNRKLIHTVVQEMGGWVEWKIHSSNLPRCGPILICQPKFQESLRALQMPQVLRCGTRSPCDQRVLVRISSSPYSAAIGIHGLASRMLIKRPVIYWQAITWWVFCYFHHICYLQFPQLLHRVNGNIPSLKMKKLGIKETICVTQICTNLSPTLSD